MRVIGQFCVGVNYSSLSINSSIQNLNWQSNSYAILNVQHLHSKLCAVASVLHHHPIYSVC